MAAATRIGLPLRQAGRLFPSKPDGKTVWRWIAVGVRRADGVVVKLRATVFVHRYYVTAEDAEQFIRDQQPAEADRS